MQSKQLNQALVIALITSAGFMANTAHALTLPPTPSSTPSYASWNSSTVYNTAQRVSYNGAIYEARWWTQGNNPAESGEWGPWKLISGSQPTPTPSATPMGNQAPSISFSTNTSVSCLTPFVLNATASDSDGSVSKVEFFVDNALVGSKTSAPYELTVANSPTCQAGSQKVMYAIATDNQGLQTRSASITVNIISDVPPTPNPTPISSYPSWDSKVAYTTGQRVAYNGRAFEAKWWTQGQTPNAADQWGPWKDLGLLVTPTPTASPTATPLPTPCVPLCNTTPSPTPSATPSPSPTATPVITASPSPTPSATPNGSGAVSSVQVSTWKNGAKGAYSLVHDDYCSMYYANDPYIKIIDPELTKRGLVASFGMITSNCSDQHWAAAKEFMAHGHEIVSHSRSHPNPYIPDASLETEMNGATADMAAKLDGYKPSYFIWPGDVASTKAIEFLKAQPNFIGGRATHLVDGSGPNNAVDYTTMPAGVNPANFDNPYRIKWDLFTADGKWSLYPMGSEILNLHIDAAINQGGWATRTSHSVDTGYYETIPLDRYTKHLDYAKAKVDAGELWMDTPSNVIKYRYARDFCKLIVPSVTPLSSVSFDTSAAECKKYATPITLQVKAIYQGGGLSAQQNGKALVVKKGANETYFVTADPLAGAVSFAYFMP
ncbi:carbohydrate-binding protein [Chitinibacter fontanus]|nr:carbohydrate-binding protein [Chitinibacter fontanus]